MHYSTHIDTANRKHKMTVKQIPNGYTGKMTWAVIVMHAYGYDVIESGFSTKRAAMKWATNNA